MNKNSLYLSFYPFGTCKCDVSLLILDKPKVVRLSVIGQINWPCSKEPKVCLICYISLLHYVSD